MPRRPDPPPGLVSPHPRGFAIVPAAGASRRMGRPKLLLPWRDGRPILAHVLEAWLASPVSEVVVAARADDLPLRAVCEQWPVALVAPSTPPPEMKDSIALALEHARRRFAPRAEDAWLLAPADMPDLAPAVIAALLEAHRQGVARGEPAAILRPTRAGRRGHPALFPWPLADEVARLGENEGVDALVRRRGARDVEIPDMPLAEDVDTPEDYQRGLRRDV